MRLAAFIDQNLEPILREWERFARTIDAPGKELDADALRDHAGDILRTVAADLRTWQSPHERTEKAQGHAEPSDSQTAAETHAVTRLLAGFSLDQMVSEYRALRASVLRLWMEGVKGGVELEIDDVIRFNEAIDQALAESIGGYSRALEASRNVFLGVLGHDLRGPLGAISLGAEALARTDQLGEKPRKICSMIQSSVRRLSRIVGDLLDFTRSQLPSGIPVRREEIDLVPVCESIVEEVKAFHVKADIQLQTAPTATGWFDSARLEQVFSNLISNAVQHGDRRSEITVTLGAEAEEVVFSVRNGGAPIPADALPFIFNPMGRYSQHAQEDTGPIAGLGLGLYIASEIVTAHSGSIDVTSTAEEGTIFVVRLPCAGAS
ncbi:Signal transduction histidine kinase [Halopseudomonas xinjiangensis]|uniref:histidine kinase n=1 Tax=Halopseudomonas xinjiangensis TaxID=487184 RepID=A0A1H1R572_9GAMM|nr:HAMP domain-containing sensor histidine kinase [Halopseudomonas xinjiangensis]SDS30873.1 Signal transduction histidine kinase [Halopseudomonas xinjiangensis]